MLSVGRRGVGINAMARPTPVTNHHNYRYVHTHDPAAHGVARLHKTGVLN